MEVPSVSVRVVPHLEVGVERDVAVGGELTLGRLIRGEPFRADRVGIPGRWLGVGRHVMVPQELVVLSHEGAEPAGFPGACGGGGAMRVAWRAGPAVPQAQVTIRAEEAASSPGGETRPSGADPWRGCLRVTAERPARLVISRFTPQTARFVDRLTVDVTAAGPRAVDEVDHDWGDLVQAWWRPRHDPRFADFVTWQACLQLTFRLAADAPPGRLTRIVAEGLVRRGYQHADTALVTGAWLRGIVLLCRILSEPGRRWMVDALGLPWIDEYVAEVRAGVARPVVTGGERHVRELRQALRATGRPEWS